MGPFRDGDGAAVGAILHRAKDLGVIGSDRYRSLTVQLNSRGWRSNEPVNVPMEKPVLLRQSLQRAWPVNTSHAASEDTGVAHSLVAEWPHLEEAPPPSAPAGNVVTLHSRHAPSQHWPPGGLAAREPRSRAVRLRATSTSTLKHADPVACVEGRAGAAVKLEVTGPLHDTVTRARQAQYDAEEARTRARAAQARTVSELLAQGLTMQDVATLMGITKGRVSQIAKAA